MGRKEHFTTAETGSKPSIIFWAKNKAYYLCLAWSFLLFVCVCTDFNNGADAQSSPDVKIRVKSPSGFKRYGVFRVESALQDRIGFWVDIYSRYGKNDIVIHDKLHPSIVYKSISIASIKNNTNLGYWARKRAASRFIREEKKNIKKILLRLHENRQLISSGSFVPTKMEEQIIKLFKIENNEDKFLMAAGDKRIRSQSGLKESFKKGIYESGRYLPEMKRLLANIGMPKELAYLPFLESGFNKYAMSKVGASGLWQFMPATGKIYLRVDDVVDERNDPMRAAEAAAQLLKKNYETLNEWPLAITAYNHGRRGMQRAVKSVGSSKLSKIIDNYESLSFGFASKNFYSSFIAALHVAQNYSFYFGELVRANPLLYDEFVLPEYVDVKVLATYLGVDLDSLKRLNPALTKAVYKGDRRIPVGYTLRIPISHSDDFLTQYGRIPAQLKFKDQVREADDSNDESKKKIRVVSKQNSK